jgi:hypothetical protein
MQRAKIFLHQCAEVPYRVHVVRMDELVRKLKFGKSGAFGNEARKGLHHFGF